MNMPEQLRKQTEAVQELYRQMEESNESEAEVGTQAEVQTADSKQEESRSSAPEQTAEDTKSEEDFVQKYKTLQGMYNAEVPRLRSQNKDLTTRVQQLEQLLATMNATNTTNSQPQAEEKYVTDEDITEYGDSIDVMRKVTREELSTAAKRIAQLENTISQLQSSVIPQVQQVAQRQAASTEQQFWSDLANQVPNWREVNDNEAFQSWLLDIDPLTGISRQTYLEDAQRNLDAQRVASFFRAWEGQSGGSNVAQPSNVVNSELEKQVSPGKTKSAGTPVNNSGKMYTAADIKKFFEDVRKGHYRGREEERDRIERDIFSAQREGRLQSA